MAGEYINATNMDEYWSELKNIYMTRSSEWKNLSKEQYEAIEHSEREDSDNHLNEERLGKDTQVIDICHYKFLPDREVAYYIQLIHKDSTKKDLYFQIRLKEGIAIN